MIGRFIAKYIGLKGIVARGIVFTSISTVVVLVEALVLEVEVVKL